jgi:excisionase family DNA binding protein
MFTSSQPLLSIREVSQMFAVGKQTVARWIHDGDLRSLKIGGSVRIRVEDVDAFIKACETARDRQLDSALPANAVGA